MSFGFLVAAAHGGLRDYEIDALRTGPFVSLFACLLATLTHLLAPHCLLRSRAHSLTRSIRFGPDSLSLLAINIAKSLLLLYDYLATIILFQQN